MSFNDEDFINLLEYYRNQDNFHKKSKIPFDNLDNISKSGDDNHFIENRDIFMFNFDNLCFNANLRNNGKPINKSLPATCDALCFDDKKCILYFFEFKNLPLNSIDYKYELKSIIETLESEYNIDKQIILGLNRIYGRFEDEIICKLKTKTNDSLFFSLPLIYRKYCEKFDLDFNKYSKDFILWLLNSENKFIFVFADNDNISPLSHHISFDIKLKDKLKHFESVSNIKTMVVTKKDFENNFLHNISDNS